MNPILDVMQTMPPFVYLIPVVMLLGIGRVPGFIAVVIYAIPPIIRLTDLGIRLVDKEVLEAADAFGCSRWQKLWKVQMPLAMPTIMAGINQTIMMALGMVVIASMIGVQGLGLPCCRPLPTSISRKASSTASPSSASPSSSTASARPMASGCRSTGGVP
jgi:glycine betaine/proline transport system permease protein